MKILNYLKTLIYFFSILMSELHHDLIVRGFWGRSDDGVPFEGQDLYPEGVCCLKTTLILIGRQVYKVMPQ